tara:strand:- start:1703 stop:2047 length:345 start_codon:yes stop_codon:yes gene_type:complete
MVGHGSVLHHFHKRKRVHKKLEEYPSDDKRIRFMDKAIYVGIFIGIALTIPQAVKIWVGKDATGVSVITWFGYMLGASFWLYYGYLHKEKPIVIKSILWIILYIIIVVGVFLYG